MAFLTNINTTTTGNQETTSESMQRGPSSPRVETPTRLKLEGSAPSYSNMGASENDALRLPSTNSDNSSSENSHSRQRIPKFANGTTLDQGYSTSPDVRDTISRNGILHHQGTDAISPPKTTMSPPPQQPLRRITSSLAASSAVAHSLFGESVGPCWGDFSCSHMRIQGRLFATSQAILFYTNLLGFERRICLLLRDVVELELFRTTSIRIETMDGETYIFRSFNDREQVLHVLNGLKILAQKKQNNFNRRRNDSEDPSSHNHTQVSTRSGQESSRSREARASAASGQPTFDNNFHSSNWQLSTTSPPSSPRMIPNRERASSDSIVRVIHDTTNFHQSSPATERHPSTMLQRPLEPIESSSDLTARPQPMATSRSESPLATADALPIQDSTEPEEDETLESPPNVVWANVQQTKNSLLEVGLESLSIPCSLDDYHKLFLADNAQYSLDYYQKEYIKDRNVSITGWDVGADGVSFHRSISFTHPIKNSMGIGPSSAQTSRQQRLRKFPGIGLALENKTVIEGIPGADCFHIQDIWLLEFVNESESRLSVHFDIIFQKRSMFKSIIQKNVRKETKQWIAGYVDMVEACLDDNNVSDKPSMSTAQESSTRPTPIIGLQNLSKLEDSLLILAHKMELAYWAIASLVFILILVVVFFGYHMWTTQRLILEIQAQLQERNSL